MKRIWLLAFVVLWISACTVPQPKQTTSSGPAATLLAQAQEQASLGEQAQAIALTERALRLEPRNGSAWLALAKLHYSGGDMSKAEQFARRALQFSGGNKPLEQACRELIEKIGMQVKQSG